MSLIVCPMFRCGLAATLMLAASLGIGQAQTLHVTDLQGNEVERLSSAGTHAVVLIFAATDCPISNRYIPQIEELRRKLASQGVAIWWVFPNPGDTLAAVQKHARDFSVTTPTLIDSRHDLVRMARVSVTPEAAVFAVRNGSLSEVYRGRIDDRYVALGKERPQAAHHDLEETIKAVLANQHVAKPQIGAIGCSIIPMAAKP
jgi:hypothetical protein